MILSAIALLVAAVEVLELVAGAGAFSDLRHELYKSTAKANAGRSIFENFFILICFFSGISFIFQFNQDTELKPIIVPLLADRNLVTI